MFLERVFVLCLLLQYTSGLQCYVCASSQTNEECLKKGQLQTCTQPKATCELHIRHEGEGNRVVIEKHCQHRHSCKNDMNQNRQSSYPAHCDESSPSKTCKCCCSRSGCNRDLLTCWKTDQQYDIAKDSTLATICEALSSPANANMQSQGNLEPGTTYKYNCHNGFYMVGEKRLTCLGNYTWDFPVPRCEEKYCNPKNISPKNGFVTCSHQHYVRSRCRFRCRKGFGLVGSTYSDCVDTGDRVLGKWTAKIPYCKPLVCDPQGPMNHGGLKCTKRRKIGSVCRFQCAPGYEFFPLGYSSNYCKSNGKWNRPFPCCNLPCPPYAIVDFVIILDSSSSVREENWKRMKSFVRQILKNFILRPDAAQLGVFRYNRVVDTSTQILLTSFRNDISSFFKAFNAIPYNGEGTYTGNALNYVVDVMFKQGNRSKASDVVLLITDGKSQDDVAFPAYRLRKTGAKVLVLPIKPPGKGELDLKQISQIAGNPKNILTDAIEGGFEALTKGFARSLGQYLCPDVCANPFHDHPGETPDRLKSYSKDHLLH